MTSHPIPLCVLFDGWTRITLNGSPARLDSHRLRRAWLAQAQYVLDSHHISESDSEITMGVY